jgi:hypothetical protein
LSFLEDLRISKMTESAKGTIESPGINVAAKSGLNRRILDQGWGEFRRQLEYKLAWKGGLLGPDCLWRRASADETGSALRRLSGVPQSPRPLGRGACHR